MMAKIAYQIDHVQSGAGAEIKYDGWYIVRLVISEDGRFIDRKPIAKFMGDDSLDEQFNMADFDDYCKGHHRVAHRNLYGAEEFSKL